MAASNAKARKGNRRTARGRFGGNVKAKRK